MKRYWRGLGAGRIGCGPLAIVVLVALQLWGCTLETGPGGSAATQTADDRATPERLSLSPGDEIILRGKVLENNLACERDAACTLRIQADLGQATVIYHYGEAAPCPNETAARAGMTVQKGDLVEVFGQVGAASNISTCESADYYLRKVTGLVEEGAPCESDCDCADLDCSQYLTEPPEDQDEGFCIFTGERICFQGECTCQLICT